MIWPGGPSARGKVGRKGYRLAGNPLPLAMWLDPATVALTTIGGLESLALSVVAFLWLGLGVVLVYESRIASRGSHQRSVGAPRGWSPVKRWGLSSRSSGLLALARIGPTGPV